MSCTTPQALSADLLMPNVGEVAGGTVREERCQVLTEKLRRLDSVVFFYHSLDHVQFLIAVFSRAMNINGTFHFNNAENGVYMHLLYTSSQVFRSS